MLNAKHIFVAACAVAPGLAASAPILFSASGANPASIQATVTNFQNALGNPNNGNAAGPLAGGRREINWDGGSPAITDTAPGGTPFNVFLNTRGASFTTPGTGFVQAPPSGGSGGGLAAVFSNPSYGTIFTTFSPSRLFAVSGRNITDADFFVPGTNGGTPALIRGFGAVFADVDLADTTTLEFFDAFGVSLGKFSALPANNGLSFLGVAFSEGAVIDRVRITTGNAALGPNDGGGVDVVAMDDFLFGEPQAAPEPSILALLGLGLGGLLFGYRRKYKR